MSDVSGKVTIRDRGKTSGAWIARAGDGLAVSHGYGWFTLDADEWAAFKSAGDRLLAGTCEATGTPSGTVCGVTPAALYAGVCEHGHPREGRLCAKHASPPATLWCRECFELDGEAAHVCDVTPALVPEVVIRPVMPGREQAGEPERPLEAADIAYDRTHPDPYASWVNGEPPARTES